MILKTWLKGHKRPESIMTLTKVSTNLQTLAKNTLYKQTKIHKNTQGMPQKETSCFHIAKLISAGFRNVWWFCNVLQFCPKNSKKEGPQFLIAQSENIFFPFYWYCNLRHFLLGNCFTYLGIWVFVLLLIMVNQQQQQNKKQKQTHKTKQNKTKQKILVL